jgi:DNA-binding transcriptional MerR regulator
MFKIGEFSQLGQVSVRTLRLYDELGLLKPAHIDRFTDYRYYALDQLPRLNRILALKELGLSLEQITRLVNDDVSADQLRAMLLLKQSEIEQQIQEEQARLARVAARLRQIEREGQLSPYEVVLKKVEPALIASVRRIVPTVDEMVPYRCAMFAEVYDGLSRNRITPGEPELALYHNPEYTDQNIDMEAAVVVEAAPRPLRDRVSGPLTLRELPAAPLMASVVHHGRFSDVVDALIALYCWVGSNGYAPGGAYREIHLFGREIEPFDPNAVTLEVQLPIEPR